MGIGRRQVLGSVAAAVAATASGCSNDGRGADPNASPATGQPDSSTAGLTPTSTASTSLAIQPWADADFGSLERYLVETNTNAFSIWERGDSVYEWHRDDPDYRRDIASAQKSVLSLLVGRAIADELFGLDTEIDEVLGGGWASGSPTAGITVRHLLTMTSGLDDRFQVVGDPGVAWLYSGAFAALFDVLTTTTGRDLQQVAQRWLFEPAGAGTAEFRERRISEFAPVGLMASAADLIAIGRSVTERSQPGLDPNWLDDSFGPSQAHNQGYGYLWWLNGHDSFLLPGPRSPGRDGSIIPTAPDDLVAALGKDDQKLYVSRANQLVVARLGGKAVQGTPALTTYDPQLWKRLTELREGS